MDRNILAEAEQHKEFIQNSMSYFKEQRYSWVKCKEAIMCLYDYTIFTSSWELWKDECKNRS